ncbi:MAG TPA: hypothetical protein VG722_00450, partial [Tepidisphaeraceae bacterium]|nr:hypothetical protein [Tepidisphaeraceae bacterium]
VQPTVPPTVNLLSTPGASPNKIFFLNLTSPNADIVDPTVIGTVANDNPDTISIDATNASVTETPAGVVAYFTISLDAPVDQNVTVDYTLGASGDTAIGATPQQIEDGSVKLNATDYLAQSLSGTLTFTPGVTTQRVSVLVLDNFGTPNGFNIDNEPDKTFTLTLSNPADPGSLTPLSLPTPTATGHITDDPVQNLNVGGTGTKYVDNSGNTVTVTLSGPGSAAVQKRGGENSDGIRIVLTGTTAASHLNIKTSNGQTTIDEIDADSPVGSINAPGVNLTGSMSLSGGLSNLRLNSITPAPVIIVPGINLALGVQVTIGGGPLGSIIGLKAKIGRITDTSFDLGIPIQFMKADSFNNQDAQANQISTPSIGSLKIATNFDENIQTNVLGRLTVGDTIKNSNIQAVVSVGRVTARSIVNSQIFAGLPADTMALPTSGSDFASGSFIKSVSLRGPDSIFSGSSIAAASIGSLQLGNVQPGNNGSAFGVATMDLGHVRGSTETPFSISRQTGDLGVIFSDVDFVIAVYGA